MKNLKPFFSVVIPTYNRADKLKVTLQSVIVQSFTDFEILVVDDGSTDHTKAVIDTFQDDRINYFWMRNSGGPATPRNYGIDMAQGDWVCFLDADDIWYSDKLKLVYEVISNESSMHIICHNEIMHDIRSNKKSLLKYGPYQDDFYRIMLKSGNRLSTSATVVNRIFLNQHNLRFNQSPHYVIVEDYDLWLRIAHNGGKFYFIDDPLGEYIIEDDNISSNAIKLRNNSQILIKDHVYFVQNFENDKDMLFRYINATQIIAEAKTMMFMGHFLSCIKLVFDAFKKSPAGVMGYISMRARKLLGR
jgi:glycosyltransferase involved in cell wall biosynthesis